MGAAGALAAGLRRAVRGVRDTLPGQTEAHEPRPTEQGDPTGAVAVADAAPAPARAPAPAPDPTRAADPVWTDAELPGFRAALEEDVARLRAELHIGEADLADLIADAADGTGDDQADTGSKRLEREQEMSVNANTRDLIAQSLRALQRLDDGTYGMCESCGQPIRAGRLRAFPRATLCVACKQAEERR